MAELIRTPPRPGPSNTIDALAIATLGWVNWRNTTRLHGNLADRSPA